VVRLILDAIGRDSLKKGHRLLAPTRRCLAFRRPCPRAPPASVKSASLTNANRGVFGVDSGTRPCLTLRIQRIELLRAADPTQSKAADRSEVTAVLSDRGHEGRGHQNRLVD
jgi:hypothetical protein